VTGARRTLLASYLVLLVASHVVWRVRGTAVPLSDERQTRAAVPAFAGGVATGETTGLAALDLGSRDAPVVLLLHGSPGNGVQLRRLAERLASAGRRVLVPDLPGFGASRPWRGGVSIVDHAEELAAWLEELGVARAHVVGFSMGGGVGLELWARHPQTVRSLVLLASIGVQELELFGRADLNHAVHGLQLGLFQLLRWLAPHFGGRYGDPFSLGYPLNFFETDQRPLRGILERFEPPLCVLHGEQDFLVPLAAALEHARVVPQSELTVLRGENHFLPWTATDEVAGLTSDFFERVESGAAPTRSQAEPERIARAASPFDPRSIPSLEGFGLAIAVLLLAAGTLVSEDLTCLAAGLWVSQGRIGFLAASAGCFLGILVGDLGLYAIGRLVGRPALARAPLRWIVSERSLERARAWFAARGALAIFLSRFTPGLRLPTYVVAGMVGTRLAVFAFWFALAGLVWTPALVGLAKWLGDEAGGWVDHLGQWLLPALLGLLVGLRLVQKVLVPACTWRGRRKLAGAWRRWVRWEFWPPWLFYVPVVGWLAWLSARHGGFGRVAATNPAIPGGGFVGESKSAILEGLGREHPAVARWELLRAAEPLAERRAQAAAFLARERLAPPVVLKPDVGQRGSGVRILRDAAALDLALREQAVDSILQEFVGGVELGVFWMRAPSEARGRIFSITEKRLPELLGDGRHTLEELILADGRAVALWRTYCAANAERLAWVPPEGTSVRLVELGTHARGAIFLDGAQLETPALADAIEELSARFEGFHFGRFDLRGASLEHIARGEFRVLELNGVTSEATHIYDPRTSLRRAYATLFRQWSWAFRIARENLSRGRGRPTSLFAIARAFRAYRARQHAHAPAGATGAREEPAQASLRR